VIRKGISKKLRFEIFKRDKFTCQYCGRTAPDVVLHVDHIHPVSRGGENDLLNLITSCFDCNAGKAARELGDDAVIAKQRKQLDDLQERREQLSMMMDWQRELLHMDIGLLQGLADFWAELVPGYFVNENEMQMFRGLVRKFGLDGVMEAMKISTAQYLEYSGGTGNDAWISRTLETCSMFAAFSRKGLHTSASGKQ